jgi:hypothetical protein
MEQSRIIKTIRLFNNDILTIITGYLDRDSHVQLIRTHSTPLMIAGFVTVAFADMRWLMTKAQVAINSDHFIGGSMCTAIGNLINVCDCGSMISYIFAVGECSIVKFGLRTLIPDFEKQCRANNPHRTHNERLRGRLHSYRTTQQCRVCKRLMEYLVNLFAPLLVSSRCVFNLYPMSKWTSIHMVTPYCHKRPYRSLMSSMFQVLCNAYWNNKK